MNTLVIRLFGVLVVAILTTSAGASATASTTLATVSSFQNRALAQSSARRENAVKKISRILALLLSEVIALICLWPSSTVIVDL